MLGAFGNAALESHVDKLRGKLVAVDKLAVAEHLGCHAENLLDFVGMEFYLDAELLGVDERSQRMVVGLGQEFHFTCVGQFFEDIHKFGHILLALLERNACDGDGTAEFTVGVLDHFQQALCGGDVAAVGNAGDYVVVGKIIVIVMVVAYVEKAVAFQAERLVNLEIEANRFHIVVVFLLF